MQWSSNALNLLGEKENPFEAVAHHDELSQFLRAPVGPQEVVAQLLGAVGKVEKLNGVAAVVVHLKPPLAVCVQRFQPQQAKHGPLQVGMRRIENRYPAPLGKSESYYSNKFLALGAEMMKHQ